jgi:hypothetical protein
MNKGMKWFFAISERSLMRAEYNWPDLILTAVISARRNTRLIPNMLYDGEENAFTADLRFLGVNIIHHRVSFYETLANVHPENKIYIETASGAFLRVDIPAIVETDEYVVYTDCDVLFLKDPAFEQLRPRLFAAAPQMIKDDYNDMNSGVMVINVPQMRSSYRDFVHFIENNIVRLSRSGYDQPCLREFYKNKYEPLAMEFNWKPYWGYSDQARIVHFHGPKPIQTHGLSRTLDYPCDAIIKDLYLKAPESYSRYLSEWNRFQTLGKKVIRLAPRDPQGVPLTVLPLEFDEDSYLAANPDVAAAQGDALSHYLIHGFREGRKLHS